MARLGKFKPLSAESLAMPAFSSDALAANMCRLARINSFPSEFALAYRMSSAYSNALKTMDRIGAPSASCNGGAAHSVSTLGISISRPAAASLASMSEVADAT
eukprot:2994718-Amphidinium_carterae.2